MSQGWSFLVENGYVAIPILAPRTSPSTSVPRQQRPYPQHLGGVKGVSPAHRSEGLVVVGEGSRLRPDQRLQVVLMALEKFVG